MLEPSVGLGTIWEAIADTIGAMPALISSKVSRTWSDFDTRAAKLAQVFAEHGVGPGGKVGMYLFNGPEYVESTFAAFKRSSVPVNVNYRYTASELTYLLNNSECEVLVCDSALVDNLVPIADELTFATLCVVVGMSDTTPEKLGSIPVIGYEQAIATHDMAPRMTTSGDDLWFLYTGGTTGLPKGVMWPHSSLWEASAATFKGIGVPFPTTLSSLCETVRAIHNENNNEILLPAAPLMHGTSAISSWGVLNSGGALVTLAGRSYDASELVDGIVEFGVTNLTIVGDAFAIPLVDELERRGAAGTPADMSTLKLVVSSGVMWSHETKERLLEFVPHALLADLLGSSEGVGIGRSLSSSQRKTPTASFRLGDLSVVIDENDDFIQPGSDEIGHLGVTGAIPIGYFKDPKKTADTFRSINGTTYSIPGDLAKMAIDGTIVLLGRGSHCINTAGEKVFPEEVEERLKQHAEVVDALVIGIDDNTWGSAVTAVVQYRQLDSPPDVSAIIEFCRETLAGYKCPKLIVSTPKIRRAPNGKPDYQWAGEVVTETQRAATR